MGKTSKEAGRFSFLLSAAIATSAAWAPAQSPASPLAQLHVRVYDYVQMPSKVLAMAEGQAGKIFRQAGVEATWENSNPAKDPSKAKPTSPRPPDAASVDVRIVTHFESITGVLRYDSMGLAVPPDTATISLEWVEKLASLGTAEEYQVLGAAMAHEMGHLFLGPNSHSPVGIMRAGWKEDDLLKASQARLTFTADQADRIRAEVRRRQEQQRTRSASAGIALTPPSRSTEPGLTITLRVYNYARVPIPILVSTEAVAKQIFHRAGLQTEWLDCRLSAAETRTPACERPLTTSDLILKLLPPSMAQSVPVRDDTFGIALTADGKPATDAIIFYERALDLARTGYVHEQEILAAAMAHEIGHLLLGSNSHGSRGIMRAKWTRDELELARLGRLLFTPEQSGLIRAEVSARAGQPASGVSKLHAVR